MKNLTFFFALAIAICFSVFATTTVSAQPQAASDLVAAQGTKVYKDVFTTSGTGQTFITLNRPSLNNKPNALVYVIHNMGNGTKINFYTAAEYDAASKRWRIVSVKNGGSYNANIPNNANFDVLVFDDGTMPTQAATAPQVTAFSFTATASNTSGHIATINHAATNNKPDAIVIVYAVLGIANSHQVGVWYNNGKWKIYNEDLVAMPANTKFNVLVFSKTGAIGVGNYSTLSAKAVTPTQLTGYNDAGMTAAIVPIDYTSTSFVSQNYKLSNGGYNANPIGIINSFDEQQTIIANENNAIMTEKIKFNIVSVKYTAP